MFDKLRQLDQHYSVLQAKLNAPETYNDPKLVAELNRELRELEEVVTAYRSWEQWDQSCRESETLLRSEDPELRELAKERQILLFTCHGREGKLLSGAPEVRRLSLSPAQEVIAHE